jgi:hypothetical protein
MGPLDALWHLANLFIPALLLGALAAALAKLVWRRDLRQMAWRRLALGACAAAVLATLAGLVLFGRDGKMATYAAMVAASAVTLWWQGFGPARR